MPEFTLQPVQGDPFKSGALPPGFDRVSASEQAQRDQEAALIRARETMSNGGGAIPTSAVVEGSVAAPKEPVSRATMISSEIKARRQPAVSYALQPVEGDPFSEKPPGGWGADIAHGLKVGADVAAQDVRELVGRVPGIGKSIVSALDSVDAKLAGKPSDALLKGDIEAQTRAMTPEQQAAGQKRWDTLGPDSAWRDPRSYSGALAQSIPEQVLTMFPAARLAMGANAAAIARGLSGADAAAAAVRTATVAGSVGEGALGGAQSSREVRDEILKLKPDELRDSEALKSLLGTGLTFEQARAQLADDASTKAFFLSGVATGVFGGMGDRVLAKAMTGTLAGGLLKRTAKGMVGEGGEELLQSGFQQAGQNVAMQEAVPDTPITKDVANQALGGLAIGSAQGGAQTAVFGRAAPAQPGAVAVPEAQTPGAPAAPAPGTPVEPEGLPLPFPGAPTYTRAAGSVAEAGPEPFTPPLPLIEQAKADAAILQSGQGLLGADDIRTKNATLMAVYGDNPAVRHAIEGGFTGIADAMLRVAPTVERVRGALPATETGRDITADLVTAVDELAQIRKSGKSVAEVLARGVPHDISYEGQQLMQFLDENIDNPVRLAAFMDNYLQIVEDMGGVPSSVRGRAFDIMQEGHAARRKQEAEAGHAKAEIAAKKQRAAEEAAAREQVATERVATETKVAEVAGSGAQPENQTAIEIAFANAKKLKGKNAKQSEVAGGSVPGTAEARAGSQREKGGQLAGQVFVAGQPNESGDTQPVRPASGGAGAENVARAIADERTDSRRRGAAMVKTRVIQAETGKRVRVTERADAALQDINHQIKTMEALLECLA